jgi:hypothetical protein
MNPLSELRGIYTLMVSVILPCILIVNQDFVTLWVGPEKYGGTLLSIALALATAAGTQVVFLNLVASATGQVRQAAYLTAIEAAVRLPLLVAGLHFLGPIGMPLSTSLTCAFLVFLAYPAVIGKGLDIAPTKTTVVVNSGLRAVLSSLALGGFAAGSLPVATHWSTLVVKGGGAALVLLGGTVLLSAPARTQLRVLSVRASQLLDRRA